MKILDSLFGKNAKVVCKKGKCIIAKCDNNMYAVKKNCDNIFDMEIFKIVKDNKPSLRQRSENVEFPLDPKLEEKLLNMIEYLRLSQDPEFLEKHHILKCL